MECVLDSRFCAPGVHPDYIQMLMILMQRVMSYFQTILDGVNPTLNLNSSRNAISGIRQMMLLEPVTPGFY